MLCSPFGLFPPLRNSRPASRASFRTKPAQGWPKHKSSIVNVATGATQDDKYRPSGNYRFVSIAPGDYKITVEASGFSKSETNVTVLTEQNLNIPIH